MLMVKYTAEQTLTSNNPPEIAGEPYIGLQISTALAVKY